MINNTDILIVDDRPENLLALEALLDDIPDVNIIKSQSGNEALGLTLDHDFALILLDVQMPEMDGFETAEFLRARKKTRNIPIIFVTAINKEKNHIFKGYDMGAVDYLFKPFDPHILKSKVNVFIELHRQKKQLETKADELKKTIIRLKDSEKELRESELKHRLLIENASDAILIIQDGFLKFHNKRAEELSGYSAEELQEIPFKDHIHPDDLEMVLEEHEKRLSGAKPDVYPFRFYNKKGEEKWVEVNGISIKWNGYPAVQAFLRDITRQRKLEAHLLQSQKLEAIGTLAGGIAHDFNNILSIIMGYTEISAMNISDTIIKENLKQVVTASLRAKDLIQQILTFSHKGGQDYKPVIINPIIKEALKLLRASLPKTIEIKKEIDEEPLAVTSCPTQIHQILMNLCTNAAHSMEEKGGLMKICLTSLKTLKPLDHHNLPPGDYVKLSVSDTGCGIEQNIIKKIFDPYFTTKEIGKGTGMGLAVVHGIVNRCGGSVNVQTCPGKGSRFEILFPRAVNEPAIPKKTESTELPRGNKNIMFIDDEALLTSLGKKMLENLGYYVECYTDPLAALEVFQKNSVRYDLVITDMTMPGITGDRLSEKFIKIRQNIPIIICTGYSEKLSEQQARKMGIKAFLMKPLALSKLANTVYDVLR
ncbi:Two component system response regulator/histidine kinase, PAS domain-containing [Desulfonema limicola]|uniref:histidine kinase n=1 Tax=Desulfonema limicola TaxID=45656 RepID=A0A975GHM8_9BACT|nr:response regulator [Desulfonema limicola]QTA81582.1 Two component system response regulator/histidine kinase, PAS domain-containing [Desulfonema limicola]